MIGLIIVRSNPPDVSVFSSDPSKVEHSRLSLNISRTLAVFNYLFFPLKDAEKNVESIEPTTLLEFTHAYIPSFPSSFRETCRFDGMTKLSETSPNVF